MIPTVSVVLNVFKIKVVNSFFELFRFSFNERECTSEISRLQQRIKYNILAKQSND